MSRKEKIIVLMGALTGIVGAFIVREALIFIVKTFY